MQHPITKPYHELFNHLTLCGRTCPAGCRSRNPRPGCIQPGSGCGCLSPCHRTDDVAAGTSLPEVAASTVAAIRGEKDIAVGNVVGSNLFNLLSVLGMSSILSPDGIRVSAVALTFDLPGVGGGGVGAPRRSSFPPPSARWEGLL